MVTGLAQTVLKLTIPGVPDIYQGTELWDLSLVDPDNRRAVDWPLRARRLAELRCRAGAGGLDRQGLAELAENWRDGREKLYLVWRALALRRAHPAVFGGGGYLPLESAGTHAAKLCAFARVADNDAAVTIVPRLVARLWRDGAGVDWGDTVVLLPEAGSWRDAFSGRTLAGPSESVAELLADFPVALLARC
jgi:(1->4)-alpha-D-glucan 1-alpha-D-glucosylmutase